MAVKVDFDADADAQAAQARAQGVQLPQAFYRLPAEKRAQAFTVSGLARLDQIQSVADALAKFQAEGRTFEDFRQWAGGQDWSLPRHRLETIYRNAVQTAYMAGHWRRFDEAAEDLPYLMYDAINDSRVRPSHLAMDGVIRPVGDPLWKRWSPPCGHRCRCTLRQVSAEETRRRGGVTQNLPAEGGPDEGWGNDPRNAWRGLERALRERLDRCRARTGFANGGPVALPRWCEDGPIRDHARMLQTWIERKGEMPEPRPLILPALPRVQQGREGEAFARFMDTFGGENAARVALPSGDVVVVSDELFSFPNGKWKLGKRERDKWLLYLPEVIKSPDEIWKLELTFTEELYLLARFSRGVQQLDAMAVFSRDKGGADEWVTGKTIYVFDTPTGITRKRADLLKSAGIKWLKM